MTHLAISMENVLLVGFVFGLRHAIVSDHIAAIASLTNQSRGLNTVAKIGVVGLIHGLAGSAALVLLTLNAAESKWIGLSYILIFGLASIIGMGVLSLVIALLLNKMKNIGYIYNLVCIFGATFTIMVGALLLNEHSVSMFAII